MIFSTENRGTLSYDPAPGANKERWLPIVY